MTLEQLRAEIDALDASLIPLLEKRLDLVTQVVAYKQAHDLPVYDATREKALLDKVGGQVVEKAYQSTLLVIFSDLMAHSRAYQEAWLAQSVQNDVADE